MTSKIITTIKTPDIISVVKMMRLNDTSAPYPFGTSAVRLSLPHPTSNTDSMPSRSKPFTFPVQDFMYAYLSFSIHPTLTPSFEHCLLFTSLHILMYRKGQLNTLTSKRILHLPIYTHFS